VAYRRQHHSKRTNSLETVTVGPVEAGRERGGGSGSIFIVLMRALYIGRFRTNSLSHPHLPNSHPPTLPPPPPPLHLHRGLLPNQGELSPWTRRLSKSLRTPHITPIPIHEEHGNELERAQAPRIVTSFSSRCLSVLNAGALLRHRHSILVSAQPSFLLPSKRRFATV
jgi:hypothetical protein